MDKEAYFKNIESVILSKGYYIATVLPGPLPAFLYSIGLLQDFGFELVFCGGAEYTLKELESIVDLFCQKVKLNPDAAADLYINGLGRFSLVKCHNSWCKRLALGVYDYYKTEKINLFQIVPEEDNKLLDVPDMSLEWTAENRIWKWLELDWCYSVSPRSMAITNFIALKGQPITEISRWEDNEWEMFAGAGPDVEKEDIRIVPLGTMLGLDDTIIDCLNLEIGKGIWRDSGSSAWQKWG